MTYSIVARDPETGALGVAVQSHWPFVGFGLAWAEAGVGAVASQAFSEASYGPLGLELLRAGKSPSEALAALTSVDGDADERQVGIVDVSGRTAIHTGARCIREAGHLAGDGFTVHANMMERDTVWGAMAEAYEASNAEFPLRLVDALDAAEAQGGDIRGRQSAAILVVTGSPTGKRWADTVLDARVDDSDLPLPELRRLVELQRAYDLMDRGEELSREGDHGAARRSFEDALALAPGAPEIRFWHAVVLAKTGGAEEARSVMRSLASERPQWAELLHRLPAAGAFPDDPELLRAVDPEAEEPHRT
ncbi:MAG: DUF1028 domain-containing protein [Actinomycetota bacterium]|nr:DUF1028 domain-containing protein [Actinomycetota bacterium]